MFVRIIREGNEANNDALIIAKSMTEGDIELFYKQPWLIVAGDGGVDSWRSARRRHFSARARRFVREKHWLTSPSRRKMTSLPAQRLGLPTGSPRRNVRRPGVLRPETISIAQLSTSRWSYRSASRLSSSTALRRGATIDRRPEARSETDA